MDSHLPDRSGAWAVKTPGRGFVLTRFLLPFHRLEKEEPVRLEDKKKALSTEGVSVRECVRV